MSADLPRGSNGAKRTARGDAIAARIAEKVTFKKVAEEFNCSTANVHHIAKRRRLTKPKPWYRKSEAWY